MVGEITRLHDWLPGAVLGQVSHGRTLMHKKSRRGGAAAAF
jgi:hypothetical protein